MTITAKVIADSIGPNTSRLTTFQLKYPRFIHAEFLTHRQFSRNASSSRAIPVEKQIQMIREDTAMPIHWGKNQKGMQADEATDAPVNLCKATQGYDRVYRDFTAQEAWLEARDRAIEVAEAFVKAGYHKQIVNRILEPFSHIVVVVTASQYDNFFALRCHPDAQPEIRALADAMYAARDSSIPRYLPVALDSREQLTTSNWHLPYVTEQEQIQNQHEPSVYPIGNLIKCSAARCARVSYLTHDGASPSLEAHLALHDRLVGSQPIHASPTEHQATPDTRIWVEDLDMWEHPYLHGNLSGWQQYRKMIDGECVATYVR